MALSVRSEIMLAKIQHRQLVNPHPDQSILFAVLTSSRPGSACLPDRRETVCGYSETLDQFKVQRAKRCRDI